MLVKVNSQIAMRALAVLIVEYRDMLTRYEDAEKRATLRGEEERAKRWAHLIGEYRGFIHAAIFEQHNIIEQGFGVPHQEES